MILGLPGFISEAIQQPGTHMVIGVETSQDSICNIIGMNGKVVFQHPFHIFPISIPVC